MTSAPQAPPPPRDARPGRGAVAGAVAMTVVMIAIAAVAVHTRGPAVEAPAAGAPSMVALGDELLGTGMLDEAETPTRFRLDGIAVSATSAASDAPFEQVLRAAAARCAIDAPLDPVELGAALRSPGALHERGEEPPTSPATTLAIDGEHGFVACLDRFAPPPSRGALRYVYARRDGAGARFAVVWTDTVVRLSDLSRTERGGDVAGSDVPDLPRPPRARRRFSFVREDGRDQMVIYDLAMPAPDVERWAERALPEAGWSAPRASGGDGAELGGAADRVLVSSRAGRRVHVVLREDGTMVVIGNREAR